MKFMRWFFTLCLFLSLTSQPQAIAGVATSGGGHVVLCSGKSAEQYGFATVLDLFEAQYVFNLEPRAPRSSLYSELDLLAEQLQIVIGHSQILPQPTTADTLLHWWEDRVQYIRGPLGETDDLGSSLPLPKGCTMKQIAIFDDKRDLVRVDLDLWNDLDDYNKAALIAHEIVYRERRLDDRESSSQSARFLVGRMFSKTVLADSRSLLQNYHPTN